MSTFIKSENDLHIVSVTIASGVSISESVKVQPKYSLVGVIAPTSWDGGNISFEHGHDNTTFYPVYDSGDASTAAAEYIINTPVALQYHQIEPTKQIGAMGYLKVDCVSNVGADREVILVFNKNEL